MIARVLIAAFDDYSIVMTILSENICKQKSKS